MLYPTEICFDHSGKMTVYYGVDVDEKITCDQADVMQFTGLTNKKGREIYEGDIANVDGREDPHLVEFVPKASGGRFQFTHPKKGVWSCFPEPSIEIIGNIYENPELLQS